MTGYDRTVFEIGMFTEWKGDGCPPEPDNAVEFVGIMDVIGGVRFGTYGPVINSVPYDEYSYEEQEIEVGL